MSVRAKLLVCEKIVPPGNEPSVVKVIDLVMLVQTHGGRERTEAEFDQLFTRAGLRLARVVPTRADNGNDARQTASPGARGHQAFLTQAMQ